MDVGLVEKELASIWRKTSTDGQAVIRACMLNLIVVTRDPEDLADATKAIASLSEHLPGRALVVISPPADVAEVEAYVATHCHRGPGGARVCTEQINLEAGGAATGLVPGAILHLLCEDLPVYTWWRKPLVTDDALLQPLAELSDRFIVDTAAYGDPASALATLLRIASDPSWSGNTGDLAWGRLEPWHELLASFFDAPLTRSHVERITSLSISAGGPRSGSAYTAVGGYLAGWFGSRLGWTPTATPNEWRRRDGAPVALRLGHEEQIAPGEIASVRIDAKDAEPPASFVAERLSPYRPLVRLTVEIEGTCPLPRIQTLGVQEEVFLLCEELERDARDPVFEAALGDAVALAGKGMKGPGTPFQKS